jgi:exodeoxyribonuclease VII small subunit
MDPINPNLSFDEALRELDTLVRKLEEGRVTLEEAIESYGRGMALKALCSDKLAAARLKIEQITLNGGAPSLTPFKEE